MPTLFNTDLAFWDDPANQGTAEGFRIVEGRFHDEVDEITVPEGNSNIGNALCYEPVPKPGGSGPFIPDYCGHVGGGGR